MGAKKYLVLPTTEFTPAIQAKLKNYGQNPDYLFIEDTVDSIRHVRRIDNGVDYVILKVTQGTSVAAIREVIPAIVQGSDPYNKIYNDKNAMRSFLAENFMDVQ